MSSTQTTSDTDNEIDIDSSDDFGAFDKQSSQDHIPLMVAAELQGELMAATNDLERLQALMSDACDTLLTGFSAANGEIDLDAVKSQLADAVTALQFQDMATQLIAHTHLRLRRCSDRIAQQALGADEDGDVAVEAEPLRPNPVTQDEMDAGSVELF